MRNNLKKMIAYVIFPSIIGGMIRIFDAVRVETEIAGTIVRGGVEYSVLLQRTNCLCWAIVDMDKMMVVQRGATWPETLCAFDEALG
jgi:hypothetical protein